MSGDDGQRAWSHFLGAHALAIRAVEARLKAAGLPPLGWYDVLLELERAGGTLRIGELGDKLVIEPYNMTRLVDRLLKQGLLTRERAEDDRRGALVTLTAAGAALRRQMWPPYRRAIDEAFGAALDEADSEALVHAMKKVIARLRD
jgi:DNA-binding MarR family transcriptional regulator